MQLHKLVREASLHDSMAIHHGSADLQMGQSWAVTYACFQAFTEAYLICRLALLHCSTGDDTCTCGGRLKWSFPLMLLLRDSKAELPVDVLRPSAFCASALDRRLGDVAQLPLERSSHSSKCSATKHVVYV